MRVLVAGSTGAIGRPLVAALVRGGHKVVGTTTSDRGLKILREIGADGAILDVLDATAVEAVVKKSRPDAVIDELTSLPRHYTLEEMRAAGERDRRVRLEGGQNLYNAARAAGARRYIAQSTGYFYAPGPGLASEADPLAHESTSPAVSASVQMYSQIETRVLQNPDFPGVALRYGFFYGPGTWFAPGEDVGNQMREGRYAIIGSGQGVWSWIHVEDAALATAGALDCPPGTYNIVDDDPSTQAVWASAFAKFVRAPEPSRISEEDALRKVGPDMVYFATRLRGASNKKAKDLLGFSPRRLEWLAANGPAR